jgi:hypothetical protein
MEIHQEIFKEASSLNDKRISLIPRGLERICCFRMQNKVLPHWQRLQQGPALLLLIWKGEETKTEVEGQRNRRHTSTPLRITDEGERFKQLVDSLDAGATGMRIDDNNAFPLFVQAQSACK